MVRFLLDSGLQVFCVSWRNPTTAHVNGGGSITYVAALVKLSTSRGQ